MTPFVPAPLSSATSALMAALHESRRRDTARVMHRYQHLVADGELSAPVPAIEAARARPATNGEATRTLRRWGANGLIALVLLGIGMAHVAGVTALLRAAVPHEKPAAIVAAQGD
jgi:hypothetical protein